ncbi:AMP-dependent synthetase [Lentzea sp. NBRC 105346]|uniref:AMP-binding protein n=1 Tax=Lentzea sp. NBRC 105346 TaxID=3032205 RepID=UPI0024A1FF4F|nr:AMP-binding protein [Lentzea sp. NBRC 105346]GLZ31041.1 AMP-dependent synthetase [Lentzea sp. NBRC 105346]
MVADLSSSVLRSSDRPALIDGLTGEVLTHRELEARSRRYALALLRTTRPGDVLALAARNEPAWAVAFHGALRAGLAVTPVNPMLTAAEVSAQVRATNASVVVTAASLGDLPGSDVGTLPSVDPDAVAVMPTTSGTTGCAKVALLTHRNIVANIAQHQQISPVTEQDVFCAAIPFCHMYGQTLVLGAALAAGATVVTMPRFDPEAYLDLLHRYRVTRLHIAPPVLATLATAGPLPALRGVLCGGAPADLALLAAAEQRLGCPIRQGYGMTEASPGTHLADEATPPGSIGRPVPGTRCRVVDPVSGSDVPPGTPGELWVSGPQVMRGYVGEEPVGEWLRTGDLVRVDADGCYWVVDRLKDLIKYKGYQVVPGELESLLRRHPAVVNAGVVGVADPVAGELPHAFVVRRGDVTAEELLNWVAAEVAPYKRIRSAEFVDSLPVTPAGKLARRELRAWVTPRRNSRPENTEIT